MHPDQIGPYRIEKKIGSGGMGNVYYGVHTETEQVVAVKVLPASLAREEGFIQRFSREIQALRKVNSRHIVELYDDGSTEDGSWYYAMEFVDGETLTSLISRQQRLPWKEVSEYTLQIAAALKAAHDAGVVHRDIKPSNLMITPDGTVKLTDFGVAHMFATTRLTRTGGIVGTAEYMSPEQARGQRATKRSDLYSLGAVMYAMLTGRPPFSGTNANEVLHKQQFSQIEKPSHYVPDIPPLFEDLVCQLLEKKPERRVPDALVLSRRLEQIRSRVDFAERQRLEEQQDLASRRSDASPTEPSHLPPQDPHQHGPGPATLVRNILRQEAAAQLDKSPLARFFDNIFVLIGLLILIIGLGFYLASNASPTPEERFARAESIMTADASPAWINARFILQELKDADELPERSEDIEFMIQLADQYQFCRSLQQTTPIDGSRDSEIERLIRQAFERFAKGDVAQAREQLESVGVLVGNSRQDRYLREFIEETLEQWEGDTSIRGRHQLLATALNEARGYLNDPKLKDTAERILESAVQLYGSDQAVEAEIQQCRELLAQIRAESGEE